MRCPPQAADITSSAEQRLSELARAERLQVLKRLADPEEVNRQSPAGRLLRRTFARPQGDRCQHTALGGAIELGHDQSGQAQRGVESPDLRQRVLPGVAID